MKAHPISPALALIHMSFAVKNLSMPINPPPMHSPLLCRWGTPKTAAIAGPTARGKSSARLTGPYILVYAYTYLYRARERGKGRGARGRERERDEPISIRERASETTLGLALLAGALTYRGELREREGAVYSCGIYRLPEETETSVYKPAARDHFSFIARERVGRPIGTCIYIQSREIGGDTQ